MIENEVALQGTVISVLESDDHFCLRIFCRVQVISVELPKGYRRPELGEDVTLNGKFRVRSLNPSFGHNNGMNTIKDETN